MLQPQEEDFDWERLRVELIEVVASSTDAEEEEEERITEQEIEEFLRGFRTRTTEKKQKKSCRRFV